MRLLGLFLLAAVALAAPFFAYPVFLMQALCMALFACAFNLLFGFTGLLSFGHAAFFGSAAYVSGYLVKAHGLNPEIGILAGAMAAALLGLVFGVLSIRRQGIYFAMITLALAEVINFIAQQAPFTGGEDGLQSVPRGRLFGSIDLMQPLAMYYFVLIVFVLCFLLICRIVDSPFGQVLKAIRENEARAISLGYKVEHYKLLAFVLSATLSGVAGGMKTIVFQFASLSDVHWHMSGEVVLMVLLGGVGTLTGPAVGAILVTTLHDQLSEIGEWVTFLLGATFVVCVMAFRQGIVGELNAWRERWRSARDPADGKARPVAQASTQPG